MAATVNPYLRLIRLDKPVGTLLLLYPTVIALFYATAGNPRLIDLIVFVVGVFVTRAAGCTINDIFDRNIDKHVERTNMRPIAAGEISVFQALMVFAGLSLVAILLLIGFLPPRTYVWAVISAILLAVYPLSKRFIKIPQLVLSLAFSMPIPMVYTALDINPFTSLSAWLMFIANMAWIVAYDTNYAIKDMYDDLKLGNVNSSAITFGDRVNLIVLILNMVYIAGFVILGLVSHFSYLFYTLLAVNFLIFVYQYFTVSVEDPITGFKAFQQNIQVGIVTCLAVLFGLIGMANNNYATSQEAYQNLQNQYQALETKYNALAHPESVKPAVTPKPTKEKPMVTPEAPKPVTTPAPAEEKPVVTPEAPKPVTTPAPVEEKPVVTPAAPKPATTPAPAEEKPVVIPEAPKPATTPAPAEEKPVVTPEAPKPATTPAPAEEKPVVTPEAPKPATTPAPAEERPVVTPEAPKPATTPTPAEEKPVVTPPVQDKP